MSNEESPDPKEEGPKEDVSAEDVLEEERKREQAAIRIQASIRGKAQRKSYKNLRGAAMKALFSMFSGWGSPIRGNVNERVLHRLSPDDASWIERLRDRWLARMASAELVLVGIAAVLGIFLVAALGGVIVLFFPLNFGTDLGSFSEITVDACDEAQYNASWILEEGTTSMPPRVDHPSVETLTGWTTMGTVGGKYVAYYCTEGQWWFNICCKYLSFYFGYVNMLRA